MLKTFFSKQIPTFLKNKKLLIAIIAIIFVPILYAGMFLWAFWDPYEQLDDIPVAVVNEDDGVYFENEYLTLGNELVDKLKEEAAFDFHFVDKSTGYKGLNDQDYYILIEIPKSFSNNATTVMDDPPEKTELIYVPNESYNFLASQMGETAMLQIEQVLEENIIETYAETIFDKVDEVADGLNEAEEATEELNEGTNELKDGSGTLHQHLGTLVSKTIEFTEGVNTAAEGASELGEGTETIAAGVSELYDNSEKLRDASVDLQTGSSQLLEGTSEVSGGLQEVGNNVPQLIDGTNQVYAGLNQFHQQLPVEMSKEIKQKISEGSQTIAAGTEKLQSEITYGLQNTLAPELSNGVAEGLAGGIVKKANDVIEDAPKNIADKVSADITSFLKEVNERKIREIIDILESNDVPKEVIAKIEDKLNNISPNYPKIEQLIGEKIENSLQAILRDVQITEEQQGQLAGIIKEQIEDGITGAVDQTVVSINDGFQEYNDAILSGLDEATDGLEKQIKLALDDPIEQLQDGVVQLNEGQYVLQSGVAQLSAGAAQLQNGSQSLFNGQSSYVANMNHFTSSFAKAKDGSIELAVGASTLNSGMGLLTDGSSQLRDGTHELYEGSNDLDEGMKSLVEGTEEFNEEMHGAVEEINDVNATEETHQMIADPVQVKNEKIKEVPNYGTGFSPYFLSLGLFVGALLLSIVYPLREPTVQPTSGLNWFISKFIGLAMIGVFQALIASGVLLGLLGLEVKSVPLFILYAIITSLTFISLIQFLVTCFDDPGRFMAIIILILQLTTSAGTFPLELIPKVLQPINKLLPMTYTVSGFKAVVSSGEFSVMWQNATVLLGFTIVFMLLSLAYFAIQYRKEYAHVRVGEEALE